MGIFSNRCEALVNPVTGKALCGKALAEARKNPSWPRCGATVRKSAQSCSRCGAPAPGGWWKCPSCGEWVGNDSHFCPYCNAPLHPDERAAVAGGVWSKAPDVFAARFEMDNVEALARSGLQVQEGTAAILIEAGAVRDVLDAGSYAQDSLSGLTDWFKGRAPKSVVLLDAGEVAVPLRFDGIRTKDNFAVRFYGEVIVRFEGGMPSGVAFVSNVVKQAREVTFADLVARFEPLFRLAVEEAAAASTIDDLVRDPERRVRLRDTMTRVLEDDLRAIGLGVVRVSSGEFTSPEYENRLRELGDLDAKRRQAEVDMEVRKFESEQMLSKMRDEYELRRAKEALERELRLDELQRQAAWDRLLKQREDEIRAQGERAVEAQKEKLLAERARSLELEEEQQRRLMADRVRRQKDEDEERIRAQARQDEDRDRRWTQEDQAHMHERQEQLRLRDEQRADRRRKWDEEREIRQQWWVETQENWRRQDAERERARLQKAEDREESNRDLEHELKQSLIRTKGQIETRKMVNDAKNDEAEANAVSDVKVAEIKHDGQLSMADKEFQLQKKIDAELKAERSEIQQRLDELKRLAATANPLQAEGIRREMDINYARLEAIDRELGGKVIC